MFVGEAGFVDWRIRFCAVAKQVRKFALQSPLFRGAKPKTLWSVKKTTALVSENDRSGFEKRPQSFLKMTAVVFENDRSRFHFSRKKIEGWGREVS